MSSVTSPASAVALLEGSLEFPILARRAIPDSSEFPILTRRTVLDSSEFLIKTRRSILEFSEFPTVARKTVSDSSEFPFTARRVIPDSSKFTLITSRAVSDSSDWPLYCQVDPFPGLLGLPAHSVMGRNAITELPVLPSHSVMTTEAIYAWSVTSIEAAPGFIWFVWSLLSGGLHSWCHRVLLFHAGHLLCRGLQIPRGLLFNPGGPLLSLGLLFLWCPLVFSSSAIVGFCSAVVDISASFARGGLLTLRGLRFPLCWWLSPLAPAIQLHQFHEQFMILRLVDRKFTLQCTKEATACINWVFALLKLLPSSWSQGISLHNTQYDILLLF